MMFSIIIPVYNVAPYLRECLDSVLAQTFKDWEAICVDDGSTDCSGAILDEYAAKDTRFRILHQKNAGVSAARNAGIDAARGEWLLFLDADDCLVRKTLENLVAVSNENDHIDLIRFGYREFDGVWDEPELPTAIPKRVVDISRQIDFSDIFVYMWQFAFRRTMVGDHRFDLSYHRMEDRPFICKCLMFKCSLFLKLDAEFYGYRQREGSAMHHRPSTITWDGEIRYRIELLDWADKCGKVIPGFAPSYWMCGFFMGECLAGIQGRSQEDQRRLYTQWFRALRFLRRRKDLLLRQSLKLRIAAILPMRFWSDLIFLAWPKMRGGICS